MGALDHWLNSGESQGGDPAKAAKSAKEGHFPQKTGASSLASPLLSSANLASLSKPPAKLQPAENRGKQGALADLADLATPSVQVATKSKPPPEAFNAEDWRTYFDERAAIAEHDGGLDRTTAERQAFMCAVAQWMNTHPEPEGDLNVCHHCRHRLADTDMLAVLNGPDGHVWLHPRCHQPFIEQRRAKAIVELKAMGLRAPPVTTTSTS